MKSGKPPVDRGQRPWSKPASPDAVVFFTASSIAVFKLAGIVPLLITRCPQAGGGQYRPKPLVDWIDHQQS
jgi:hypothetical protein